MYILEDRRIAFIAHPKTASTATAAALTDLGFQQVYNHHGVEVPAGGWSGWRVISTIREPLDTLVSWYFHVNRQPQRPDFNQWLRVFIRHPVRYLSERMFWALPVTTDVLIYKHLAEDWKSLLEDLDLPHVDIPVKNVGNLEKLPPSHFFTNPDLVAKVVHRWERDFQDYGALCHP